MFQQPMVRQGQGETHGEARSGFTLIELLVVVGIISLLAAILFPVFNRVRENARRTSCLSNLKQIGIGFAMYAQDYDNKTVFGNGFHGYAGVSSGTTSRGQGWAGPLSPYLKSSQIFRCPSETVAGQLVISYGRNTNTRGQNLAIFGAPTLTVELFEVKGTNGTAGDSLLDFTQTTEEFSNGGNFDAGDNTYGFTGGNNLLAATGCMYIFNDPSNGSAPASSGGTCGQGSFTAWLPGRHFDAANYLFNDGHVKWLRSENIGVGSNAATATSAAKWGPIGTPTVPAAPGTAALSGLQGTFSIY